MSPPNNPIRGSGDGTGAPPNLLDTTVAPELNPPPSRGGGGGEGDISSPDDPDPIAAGEAARQAAVRLAEITAGAGQTGEEATVTQTIDESEVSGSFQHAFMRGHVALLEKPNDIHGTQKSPQKWVVVEQANGQLMVLVSGPPHDLLHDLMVPYANAKVVAAGRIWRSSDGQFIVNGYSQGFATGTTFVMKHPNVYHESAPSAGFDRARPILEKLLGQSVVADPDWDFETAQKKRSTPPPDSSGSGSGEPQGGSISPIRLTGVRETSGVRLVGGDSPDEETESSATANGRQPDRRGTGRPSPSPTVSGMLRQTAVRSPVGILGR